jgi:hypothetical protein
MKVEIKAEDVDPYTIDTIKIADRLDDIAERLNVVHLAIEGAAADLDTHLLGPVMTFVSEIRAQIIAVSNDVHHSPPPLMAAARKPFEGEPEGSSPLPSGPNRQHGSLIHVTG